MRELKTRSQKWLASIIVALFAITPIAACATSAPAAPTAVPTKAAAATTAPAVTTPSGAATAAPAAATAGPAQVYRLGTMGPLTGATAASMGNPVVRGAELAVEEINAAGGFTVGGQKYTIKLTMYDDKYTAEGGTSAAQKAVTEDKVQAIIGPPGSAPVLAVQPITEKEKVIIFTGAATDKDTTPANQYTFQGMVSSAEQMIAFYKTVRQKFPDLKTAAIINPNDESGTSQMEGSAKLLEANNFKVVSKEFYQRGATDFYPTLTKMLAQNPDIIDTSQSTPTGPLVKQARELGFKGKFIGGGGGDAVSLVNVAGAAADGYIGYYFAPDYLRADATPAQKSLGERYKAKYNETVSSFYTEGTYMITKALIKAMTIAGSTDSTKVIQTLRSDSFTWDTLVPGVTAKMGGEKTYGIKSVALMPFYVAEIQSGKPVVLANPTADVP